MATTSHRPGASHQTNKPFKSKHASKGQLKEVARGRVETVRHSVKSRQQSKADRKNAARQLQKAKRDELVAVNRSIGGISGAPKTVAIVSLCSDVLSTDVLNHIITHEDLQLSPLVDVDSSARTCFVDRLKQHFRIIPVGRHLQDVLDVAKVADFMILVMSGTTEVDSLGELMLASIQAQGVPAILPAVWPLSNVPLKQRNSVKKSLLSFIQYHFPAETKIFPLDTHADVALVLRHLATSHSKPLLWRDQHPYMIVDQMEVVENETASSSSSDHVTVKLTGYTRGRPLSANRLVHIPSWGTFQVELITSAEDGHIALRARHRSLSRNGSRSRQSSTAASSAGMDVDGGASSIDQSDHTEKVLHQADAEERDDLTQENIPDPLANEQTWPTDEELMEAESSQPRVVNGSIASKPSKKTRLVPKGTSSYQAAWIVDEDADNDDAADNDDDDDDDHMQDDHVKHPAKVNQGDDDDKEDDKEQEEEEEEMEEIPIEDRSGAFDAHLTEEQEEEQLQNYLKEREERSKEDLEFPDEVDTPLHVTARQRFAKYRGLKSYRKSAWDPYENLPSDYAKIFDFHDITRSTRRVLNDNDGVPPFTYVTIHVINVPSSLVQQRRDLVASATKELPLLPLFLFGLLQYEHKTSVLHFTVMRSEHYVEPVRSKDPLIAHIGFRRFNVNPIYSEHDQGDKHKMERFLQLGRATVASFFAPVTFPPCPILLFKDNGPTIVPTLVATGSLLEIQPRRVVVKRIVLTGEPFKVHNRAATVRFMFFNPEDVRWFKPVQLRTKGGRVGHIRESLGTHGYMKCLFDSSLKGQDVVCMYLYKRVYPKWTTTPILTRENALQIMPAGGRAGHRSVYDDDNNEEEEDDHEQME